jgi:hypothetical protein
MLLQIIKTLQNLFYKTHRGFEKCTKIFKNLGEFRGRQGSTNLDTNG